MLGMALEPSSGSGCSAHLLQPPLSRCGLWEPEGTLGTWALLVISGKVSSVFGVITSPRVPTGAGMASALLGGAVTPGCGVSRVALEGPLEFQVPPPLDEWVCVCACVGEPWCVSLSGSPCVWVAPPWPPQLLCLLAERYCRL